MAEIIASTYEIIKEIGAGGGGIVYLANHLRLGKTVVLKADKRGVSAKLTTLRREVDVLKELKHPYIPQVYDFFEYKGVIYTVIDFVEGESLNKPLKRGERFSQPQVIRWAIELLEALCYLHSPTHGNPPRGFVHGDIKPANIMLNSQGDICLIDFNISLALGEDRVVGYSPGYASPEHYGLDLSSVSGFSQSPMSGQTTSDRRRSRFRLDSRRSGGSENDLGETGERNGETPISTSGKEGQGVHDSEKQKGSYASSGGSYPASMKKKILPDVRSDIYSLGATLYHFLSGVRPARDAREVVPLSPKEFSPQIVEIITKAMNPNPDLRYQTAQEMLDAFLHLRERDPRVRRRKRRNLCVYSLLLFLCLAGAATAFVGLKRIQVTEEWLKLAEYSRNALQKGDAAAAIDYALETFPEKDSIFQPDYIAEGQRALTNAVGVYDLSDGYKTHGTMELPSQPIFMEISPDGKTAACVYAWSIMVFDTVTFDVLAELPTEESALAEVEYVDDHVIVYAGQGGIRGYDIRENRELWAGNPATAISVSGDGKRAAALYKDEGFATVYDTSNGNILYTVDFQGKHQWTAVNDIYANPENSIFALNEDGTLLGVSFLDGSLNIFRLDTGGSFTLCNETSGFTYFKGGFYQKYFVFYARGSQESAVIVIDAEKMEQNYGILDQNSGYGIQVDKRGIFIQKGGEVIGYDPTTGDVISLVDTSENISEFYSDGVHTLIIGDEEFQVYDRNENLLESGEKDNNSEFVRVAQGTALIGGMDSPSIRVLNFENHQESEIFAYDPSFDHDEARWSQDKQNVMLFTYKHFRIYDMMGNVIAEVSIPQSDQVYDTQYVRDSSGTRLEVIYNDGKILWYDGGDGTLLSEEQGEQPDLTLTEEFETEKFRIKAPLHGAPEVYDRNSGKLLFYLGEDASLLTYVTEIEEGIVVQYMSANGYYYGQLLDEKGKVIAELPYLCDVTDGTFIFDYPTGNMRQSRVYHIDEIKEIAKKQRGVMKNA